MSNLFVLHERRPPIWVLNEFKPVLITSKSSTMLCAKTKADSSDRTVLDEGRSLLKTK